MKYLVETTGHFMLSDTQMKQEIPAQRPAVVTMSNLFEQRVAKGQVRILLDNLTDEATDKEFGATLAEFEGNVQAAVDNFKSRYGAEDQEVSKKGTRGRKKAEETPEE